MIIEKIVIKSFGMLTDMTLDFSDEINVIVGRNESGKSTIAAFIKYMLYGFDNETPAGNADERTRYVNWENGTAQGTMHVRVGEKHYVISRVTERVSNGDRYSYKEDASIIDADSGAAVFGKIPAGEALLGVDRSLYVNTAFVGEIGDSSIREDSVKESIENILFSGSEKINNQRAASKVSVMSETLLHKSGTGGAIYNLMRRSEELRERFRDADDDNKQILAKEARLHDIRANKKEQNGILDKLTELDECFRNTLIIQSFDDLHENEKASEAKAEEHAEFVKANTVNGFFPTREYLAEFTASRRRVDDAYRALTEAEERYEEEKRTAGITPEMEKDIEHSDSFGGEDAIEHKIKTYKGKNVGYIALGAASLLVAIAAGVYEIVAEGALAEVFPRIAVAVVGAAGLGALIALLLVFFRDRAAISELSKCFGTEDVHNLAVKVAVLREERARRDKLIRDTENARIAVEVAKEKYADAKAELLSNILKLGSEPPTSNLNEFLNSLEGGVRECLAAEQKILDEKQAIDVTVQELRRSLADVSEIDIRAQVTPLKRKVLDKIEHETIVSGIKDCKLTITALDTLSEEIEAELALLKARATDPAELYSKMQENDSRIAELRANYDACVAALSAIESASDNLRAEISPRLAKYSAELISVMTDKKYTSVDVTDGLKLTFTAEDGETRSVDCLSGGTRDLTYIALRMALIDILYADKPPVCFDESFAHQDNARAKSMMEGVRRLSDDGVQSFIFTCREREALLAREIGNRTVIFKLTHGDQDMA